jgi:hypothetical protein
MAGFTYTDHGIAGANLLEYMNELLEQDGDKATLVLQYQHMQSLLAVNAPFPADETDCVQIIEARAATINPQP